MTSLLLLLTLAAAVSGLGGDPPPPPAIEIVLKNAAMVRGAEVRIADLADVLPVGATALQIGEMVFARAPVPGHTRTVTRTEVLQALVAGGQPANRFVFKGPTDVTVQGLTVDLPAQEIADAATAVLLSVLAADGNPDVETEIVTRLRHLPAPPGRHSQELQARVRDGKAGAASAIVDVAVLVDGEVWKTLPVQFRLTRYHRVLKTVGAVRAGTPLGPDNLAVSREKATETTGYYVHSLDEVAGMIARRNLQHGQLLTLGDMALPALIRRGEVVTVVMTRGRIRVTVKAVANHDAARGEVVTLTNLQSRAQLTGVAAAPGTVVVPTGE